MTRSLSQEQREALGYVLAGRPEVARAIFVARGPRPVLAFEYDECPATVGDAQTMVQELPVAVAPALGQSARELGFTAGGAEDVGAVAAGGEVVYERQ